MPSRDQLMQQAISLIESDPARALQPIEQLLAGDPKDAQALFFHGCALSKLGRLEEAARAYHQSFTNAPPDRATLPLYNLGNTLQELGANDKALEVFDMVIEMDPEHADAWINRGRLLDDAGNHAEAVNCYDTALKFAPEDVVAWSNRGNSLRGLGKHKEAIQSYRRALEIDPRDFAALGCTAMSLDALGETAKAVEWLSAAVKRLDHPSFHNDLARYLVTLGRHPEALAAVDRCIAMGVKDPQPFNNRGEILAKLGRVPESLQAFDQALKVDPNYLPAMFGKARVLQRAGRNAEAKPLIEKYLSLADSGDDLYQAALATAALVNNDPSFVRNVPGALPRKSPPPPPGFSGQKPSPPPPPPGFRRPSPPPPPKDL